MNSLLNELLALAKARGLTQNQLAAEIGVHPVTLSRALKSGNCHLSTVEAMASFLGMKLIAVPDNRVAEGLARGDLF